MADKKDLNIPTPEQLENAGIVGPEDLQQDSNEDKLSYSATIDPENDPELKREIELEEKYGDSPVKAFALALTRGLSFGASDVIAVETGLSTPEALREIDERNKELSITGEIGGTILPALFTGGSSLAAKGVTKAGGMVLAAEASRKAVEKAASQAIKNVLKTKGKERIYKQILEKSLPKAAGLATEGTFYSTGKLASEAALGREDFNAENIAATVGQVAIIGGTFAGLLGTAEVLAPVIKNGKVVDLAKKKIDDSVSVDKATWGLVGKRKSRLDKLQAKRPQVYENGKFVIKRSNIKATDSLDAVENKINEFKNNTVNKLNTIYKRADDFQLKNPDTITDAKAFYSEIVDDLEENFIKRYKDVPEVNVNQIKKTVKEYKKLLGSDDVENFTVGKLWERQKTLDNTLKSMYNKLSAAPTKLEESISSTRNLINQKIKSKLSEIADNTGDDLLRDFDQVNLDYSTAVELLDDLGKKITKSESQSMLGFRDNLILTGGILAGDPLLGAGIAGVRKFLESDLRKKLTILSGIEKANQKSVSKIESAVSNFINKSKAVAKPASMRILTNYSFSSEKKPKNETKKESFTRLSNEIIDLSSRPEKMVDTLSNKFERITSVAPNTSQYLMLNAIKAINFLRSKLPVGMEDPRTLSALKTSKYEPSSIELAKFERYLEAIENPLSALEDLEQNALTREKVEAIKAVYPALYAKIQEVTLDKISKNPEKITYQKRLQLGVLLDIPADVSLLPENIAALQASHLDPRQQYDKREPGSSVNTTQGGLNKLNFAEDAMTEVERTIDRK